MSFIYTGEKISLRYIDPKDCTEEYLSWLQDPEVNRFLETRHHTQSLESIKLFVSKMLDSDASHLFAIIENFTSQHIGNLKIGPINHNHKTADISYFIGNKGYWGNGCATEAIKGALVYAFKTLDLYSLRAGVYGANVASIKALEKCGFKQRGTWPNDLATENGRADHVWLTITLDEWKSRIEP